MSFLNGPADTFNYMVLGFGVILGSIAIFIASLAFRFRKLKREIEFLQDIEMDQGE
jgi:hypothetical protein